MRRGVSGRRSIVRAVAVSITAGILLAGLSLPTRERHAEARPVAEDCKHPHPCGAHYPSDVHVDGEDLVIEPIEIESRDGTMLRGWVGRPGGAAEGVPAPTLVSMTPYLGLGNADGAYDPNPDNEGWWKAPGHSDRPTMDHWGVTPLSLVEKGYAVVVVAVRGTAHSDGCLDYFGRREAEDAVAVVNWAATQSWSNGRVGMGGRSYMASTAQLAATKSPKALKTIVIAGPLHNLYTLTHTFQGAPFTVTATAFLPAGQFDGGLSPASSEHDPVHAPMHPRLCDETVELLKATPGGWATADRNASYFAERHPDHSRVTAAVLLASGFRDDVVTNSQDTYLWELMKRAPVRALHGYWGHELPQDGRHHLIDHPRSPNWEALLLQWLDYWLKGHGAAPETGVVDYEVAEGVPQTLDGIVANSVDDGRWLRSTRWPPAEARPEALHLSGASLSGRTGPAGVRSFLSAPDPLSDHMTHEVVETAATTSLPFNAWPALCGGADGAGAVAYISDELRDDVVLAGNPFAYLNLSSTQEGGLVGAALVSLPGKDEFDCADAEARRVHVLAIGAADLRYHRGGYTPEPFDVARPSRVRIDMRDVSELVSRGDRIALIVGYGGAGGIFSSAEPFAPVIGVHSGAGGSHIVLPVVEGTLGGRAPKGKYPEVPFLR